MLKTCNTIKNLKTNTINLDYINCCEKVTADMNNNCTGIGSACNVHEVGRMMGYLCLCYLLLYCKYEYNELHVKTTDVETLKISQSYQ